MVFRPSILAASVAAVTSTFSLHSVAQPTQLDELVVSASGVEQKVTDAPSSISVISHQNLQQSQFSNLAEALETVEGVDVRQMTGKTGGLNIIIRGIPSDYTLILIDG